MKRCLRLRARVLTVAAVAVVISSVGAHAEPPVLSFSGKVLISEPIEFDPESQRSSNIVLSKSLGTSDFSVGISFRTDESGTQDLGDLISLWNEKTRHGFTLGVRNNTGSTTSQANWRQVQFGIDAGTEPTWRDEGRPGNTILGFSLAVHNGQLYMGTCEGGPKSVGKVYRYIKPGDWKPVGTLDGANSVTALATFNGELYAGTGKYRLGGSSLQESNNETRGGKVYRLSGDDQWELIGDLDPTEAIGGLVTYRGQLYASSLYRPAGFFRYDGDKKWTSIPTPDDKPDDKRVVSLAVHGGYLYAGSYDSGAVYRFDGKDWKDLGLVSSDITQTYSFTTYQNALHVSTWPTGKVYRLGSDDKWIDCGRLGEELEVMAMLVHNGSFYGGTLPLAEVYRYDGETNWKRLKQLDVTPDVRYRRVWTMATHQGRLFTTTLPSGHVWSMTAGQLVTNDHSLDNGWHDVVAQRKSGALRLFVDGRLVAESDASDLNLETAGMQLKIGDGPRGKFIGSIKNLWFEAN